MLDAVKQAEAMITSGDADKEYLPIEGNLDFCSAAAQFVLGDESSAISDGRVVTLQTLSGTGSLAVAGGTLNTGGSPHACPRPRRPAPRRQSGSHVPPLHETTMGAGWGVRLAVAPSTLRFAEPCGRLCRQHKHGPSPAF